MLQHAAIRRKISENSFIYTIAICQRLHCLIYQWTQHIYTQFISKCTFLQRSREKLVCSHLYYSNKVICSPASLLLSEEKKKHDRLTVFKTKAPLLHKQNLTKSDFINNYENYFVKQPYWTKVWGLYLGPLCPYRIINIYKSALILCLDSY